MKVRMTEEFMEQLFTRDSEGNKLSVEWGEADDEEFYVPTIHVDYDDNIVARLEADNETLRKTIRRRHIIFNAAMDVEIEKNKHLKEHARNGDWDDERCELTICFAHNHLQYIDFKTEREAYWRDYLAKEALETKGNNNHS